LLHVDLVREIPEAMKPWAISNHELRQSPDVEPINVAA
jgi:hypothetical protein